VVTDTQREGNLEAPTRHPLDWRNPEFYNEGAAFSELERVFDICHGCRRCVNLCTAFPTLFDLVDASSTLEVDGVDKHDYWKVVDQCYLCDTCYVNYNEPGMGHDLLAVLAHNEIPYVLVEKEVCCGMPKLELGDLSSVSDLKDKNIPAMAKLAKAGYAILTPIPSCTLMFKQELPLMTAPGA